MSAIPFFPLVDVIIDDGGACHVNVAGTHHHFTSTSPEENRQAVRTLATAIAAEMRRPVRMRSTEPSGEWLVAVHPDGDMSEIPPENAPRPLLIRGRGRLRPAPTPAVPELERAHEPTAVLGRTHEGAAPIQATSTVPESTSAAAELPADLEHTRLALRPSQMAGRGPVAQLDFTDGTHVELTGCGVVGRRPADSSHDPRVTLIALHDESRRMSGTHARLEWRDRILVAVDQNSTNGTYLLRGTEPPQLLPPMTAVEVLDGDVLDLGGEDLTLRVTIQEPGR